MRRAGLLLSLWLFGQVSAAIAETAAGAVTEPLQSGGFLPGYAPLTVAGQTIPAVFLPQQLGIHRGVILIVHDVNEHIDNAAISGLRTRLPEHGWDTFSVAVTHQETADLTDLENADEPVSAAESIETAAAEPVTENTDTEPVIEDTVNPDTQSSATVVTDQQIFEAALAYLQAQRQHNIILLGHGQGGVLAVEFAKSANGAVNALVLLATPESVSEENLTELGMPILEVFGSRQDAQIGAVRMRQTAMKMADYQFYAARQLVGADHVFTGTQPQLVKTVHGWLYRQLE